MLLNEVILPRLTEDFPMNIQQSTPMTPLRARMIAAVDSPLDDLNGAKRKKGKVVVATGEGGCR